MRAAGATEPIVRLQTMRFVKKNSMNRPRGGVGSNFLGLLQPGFTTTDCECEIKQYIRMIEIMQSYSNYIPLLTPFALLVHTGAISFRCCRLRLFFLKSGAKGSSGRKC